jgi:hypothetical protein
MGSLNRTTLWRVDKITSDMWEINAYNSRRGEDGWYNDRKGHTHVCKLGSRKEPVDSLFALAWVVRDIVDTRRNSCGCCRKIVAD